MRKIKFRAWDNECGRMFFDIDFKTVIDQTAELGEHWLNLTDHIFEQFTGLKGNNDKDIYEGDICEVSFADGSKHIGTVKFNDGCFDFIFRNQTPHGFRDYVKCYTINHAVLVIGNVHDNPELIGD